MTEWLPEAPDPSTLPDPEGGELVTLPAGRAWARLYFHAGRHPARWDRFRHMALPGPARFDAFGAPAVDGILYAALGHGPGGAGAAAEPLRAEHGSALATCLAEASQGRGVLDRLDQRSFAVAELRSALRVLDVSSDWAVRAGAGTHLSTAPRREACRWAEAIATRFQDIDGVTYVTSTRPAGRALALWSPRAAGAVAGSRLLLLRTVDDPVIGGALSWAAHVTGVALVRRYP